MRFIRENIFLIELNKQASVAANCSHSDRTPDPANGDEAIDKVNKLDIHTEKILASVTTTA